MTVIGTLNEINDVIEYLNPKFPKQSMQQMEHNECFYVANMVAIKFILLKEKEHGK